ncbi:hypothetical protein ACKWTF_004621 [Chironomus riparius]
MEVKTLVMLSFLFGSSFCQSLTCNYTDTVDYGQELYVCNLEIQNPSGVDDFTEISGTHLEGRTNADVTGLLLTISSRTINFPRIICSQFTNMLHINYAHMSIVEVTQNTFSGCPNLEWLRLWNNTIEQVHEQAFANNSRLKYLNLDKNRLTTLPENLFRNLVNLEQLQMSNNPFSFIPSRLFRPLTNLQRLYLIQSNINVVNPEWFATLNNLFQLTLYGNNITSWPENKFAALRNLQIFVVSKNPIGDNLPADAFVDLPNLETLLMADIGITQINPAWYYPLQKLKTLYIYSNSFTSIPEGAFDSLRNLVGLDIGGNHLTESGIPSNLFRNMSNLMYLYCDNNLIQTINPQWFEGLTGLLSIDFSFNQINELQEGIFASFRSIIDIGLWGNNLKTLNRNAFGNIQNLTYFDLDDNNINAVDVRFLNEASPLTFFHFRNNLCASDWFLNFGVNREQLMPRFSTCTRNFEFIVETSTVAGQAYRFYTAPSPGIQLRVNTNDEVHISLASFNFLWNPSVEIIIGARNNTLSTVIMNQDTEVVVAHSPNIISPGRWTGLRITWANHVILVTREGQSYPFLAYNLQCIFRVGFYGIRSPRSNAVWSIQSVEADILPTNLQGFSDNHVNQKIRFSDRRLIDLYGSESLKN